MPQNLGSDALATNYLCHVNHFTILDVPEHFELDGRFLKRQLYSLQARHHPDHAAPGDEASSLEQSSRISEAYRVLSDRQQRIKYLLKLRNAMPAEGATVLSSDFLMDMMDLNEQIDDLIPNDIEGKQKVELALKNEIDSLEHAVLPFINKHDEGNFSENVLGEISSYYLKMRYLQRLKDRLYGVTPTIH
jgi:Fe-S protein assembly co-chaperone HscB